MRDRGKAHNVQHQSRYPASSQRMSAGSANSKVEGLEFAVATARIPAAYLMASHGWGRETEKPQCVLHTPGVKGTVSAAGLCRKLLMPLHNSCGGQQAASRN